MSEQTSPDPWEEATDPVGSPSDGAPPSDSPSRASGANGAVSADSGEPAASGPSEATPSETTTSETTRSETGTSQTAENSRSETAGATSSADRTTSPTEGAAGAAGSAGDTIRAILEDVAAGRLTPEEAKARIDEVSGSTTTTDTTSTSEAGPSAPAPATANRLRVRAVGRRVRIIGEPFVSTVAVDGPHVVRQEGDTLLVSSEGEFGASIDGFTLMRTRSLRDLQDRVFELGRELSVRVNPSLTVEVEVTAGSVNAERIPKLEQVRVTAGSARVRDVVGPVDLLVQAGSAQVEGKITKGRSRLRVESGSLQLRLLPQSSVRIRPDVQLGRVQWDPPGKDREEHVVGLGDATVDLEVVMGMATVKEAP
ncbi:hypothetical protein [Thermasporomyces composti]|jgi:hypothetical protein|uniref:Adhesin n=1 Tax=Thermasporomyces composti TaxID=696763 RepID=A0A3D9V1H3_THECX|nr:hypothetical protein [Thermasporomyces composti]REF35638.1 hypothetical protein DFJ64_1021 [Thermasporomyces composti]